MARHLRRAGGERRWEEAGEGERRREEAGRAPVEGRGVALVRDAPPLLQQPHHRAGERRLEGRLVRREGRVARHEREEAAVQQPHVVPESLVRAPQLFTPPAVNRRGSGPDGTCSVNGVYSHLGVVAAPQLHLQLLVDVPAQRLRESLTQYRGMSLQHRRTAAARSAQPRAARAAATRSSPSPPPPACAPPPAADR